MRELTLLRLSIAVSFVVAFGGCQTGSNSGTDNASFRTRVQAQCGPKERSNIVFYTDCFNSLNVADMKQDSYPHIDLIYQYGIDTKRNAIAYRDGNINREEFDLRNREASVRWMRSVSEREQNSRRTQVSASVPMQRPYSGSYSRPNESRTVNCQASLDVRSVECESRSRYMPLVAREPW